MWIAFCAVWRSVIVFPKAMSLADEFPFAFDGDIFASEKPQEAIIQCGFPGFAGDRQALVNALGRNQSRAFGEAKRHVAFQKGRAASPFTWRNQKATVFGQGVYGVLKRGEARQLKPLGVR